jgi:acyl carrier protein
LSTGPQSATPELSEPFAKVLGEVRQALIEVIGEDYLLDFPFSMETSFESDLQLESVEFVALAERLQQQYPELDFVEWVADKEVTELMQLRVGELVEFIARCRT